MELTQKQLRTIIREAILRNSIIDIADCLSTSFKVIDLLPGESWNNITNKFLKWLMVDQSVLKTLKR